MTTREGDRERGGMDEADSKEMREIERGLW